MSSPSPNLRDAQSYARDQNRPSWGDRPPSREDQDNYFDHELPAPHRLSGSYLSPSHSPRASMENMANKPLPLPAFGGTGPRYLSPLAAAEATATEGAGMRNSNYSEISMVGLNSGRSLARRSTWLEKETNQGRRNHKLFITVCSTLTLLIVLGVTLGVYFGIRNSKNNDVVASPSGTNSGGNSGTGSSSGSNDTVSGDPSQFTKDPNLKQSFYGIAYTMQDALYPDCNENLASVILDVQLMSQLTTRIRLYGSDCNQTQLVLEAIKQTKVDMKINAAIYIPVDDDVAYARQRDALQNALQTYGVSNIEGITVGNEFMLNYVTKYGGEGSGVDGAVGLRASTILKEKITETRQFLRAAGHPDVPVGSADAGAYFNTDLLRAIDYGLSNVHAWFAPTTAAGAANWTNQFFEENNVIPAAAVSNKPKMVIAETGWPTHSSDAQHQNSGAGTGGEASVANLQTFLDTFVCSANTAGTPYYMFEYSDVGWKDRIYGGVEGYWGLFDKNRKLKDLTIPDCTHQ